MSTSDLFCSVRNWQEFEALLKELFNALPHVSKEKTVYYAVKIFSRMVGYFLSVSCKIHILDLEKGELREVTIPCEFDGGSAPTWATRNLTTNELDVTARYIKNLQVDTGILHLLDEYLTFYRCKSSLVSDGSFPLLEEVFAFLSVADKFPWLSMFLPKIWFDWKELEDCWRNFLVKMPLLMKVFGYDDYEDKIYSCIEDGELRVSYKICYKRNNRYLMRIMCSEFDKNKINEINNLGEHWVTRIISSEFYNLDEAPTWATKGLTAEMVDVTERYKKFFSPRTLSNLNDIPSLNKLVAYLHNELNWREFTNRLRDFLGWLPFALKKEGINGYGLKLFSTVEKNFLSDNIVYLICKLYFKEDGKWVEKRIIQNFKESELDNWATKDLSAKEIDITERYEKNLLVII